MQRVGEGYGMLPTVTAAPMCLITCRCDEGQMSAGHALFGILDPRAPGWVHPCSHWFRVYHPGSSGSLVLKVINHVTFDLMISPGYRYFSGGLGQETQIKSLYVPAVIRITLITNSFL